MSQPSKWPGRTWLFLCGLAFVFLLVSDVLRFRRIERVNAFAREDVETSAISPTGYGGGQRWLIVPEHNTAAYQTIAETQQMLASGTWRVRRVDTENAPSGREVMTPSPLRWWLALIARADQMINATPSGIAVERAALIAGPLLRWLALLGIVAFAARTFGGGFAAILAVGAAVMFPLGSAYLPGLPDNFGLWLVCVWASVLPLTAYLGGRPQARGPQLFFVAGAAAGVGLWLDASSEIPLVVGIAAGAVVASWIGRSKRSSATPAVDAPWRWWGFGGATVSLLGYLLEFAPDHLEWRLEINHPLYALAWIGLGEWTTWSIACIRSGRANFSIRTALRLILAGAAVAIPAVVLARTGSSLASDPLALRLTHLPDGTMAANLSAWLAHEGASASVMATLIPVLLLIPSAWRLMQSHSEQQRIALAFLFVPTLVALGFAFARVRWWNTFDVLLLVLAATAVASSRGERDKPRDLLGRYGLGAALAAGVAGLCALMPSMVGRASREFSKLEVESLLERNLAHWLAVHSSSFPVTVLAPPDRTVTLNYFGGLRGLGTPNWENREGVSATMKIITATTADEAFALLDARGVTHLVLPSWDSDLDDFVRWEMPHPENSFLAAIHRWALPPQLRPMAYPMPTITGYENYSVMLLAVTEETDRAASVSRIAEYFIETKQLDRAVEADQALLPYPASLGALVARAQVARAREDSAAFDKFFATIVAGVSNGLDRSLAWDRRLSLAITLALGHRNDLAEIQLQRCLKTVNETRIRSLTSASLYRFQFLAKAFKLTIEDAKLRELARALTPAELRERI